MTTTTTTTTTFSVRCPRDPHETSAAIYAVATAEEAAAAYLADFWPDGRGGVTAEDLEVCVAP